MKLEKRGDVTPEEAAAAEEASQKSAGKQKPVLLYLVILFAIALFLILFSFLVQNHTSAMEMQELQNQADAAQELRIQYSESQAENESLRQQIESLNSQIAEELAVPPVKIHCSILAEDAIKAAIEDYRSKQK